MKKDTAQSLWGAFGYIPNEAEGEQWTIYQSNSLIVVHADRKPRIYRRGCGGSYCEVDPNFGAWPV